MLSGIDYRNTYKKNPIWVGNVRKHMRTHLADSHPEHFLNTALGFRHHEHCLYQRFLTLTLGVALEQVNLSKLMSFNQAVSSSSACLGKSGGGICSSRRSSISLIPAAQSFSASAYKSTTSICVAYVCV